MKNCPYCGKLTDPKLDNCVHCGAALGDDGVPVLAGGAHTWLHSACHPPWLAERRRHATEALRAMGIAAAAVLK